MAYLHKQAFVHLIKLWLRLGCGQLESLKFSSREEYIKWLMANFLPEKFINDIDNVVERIQET